MKPIPIECRTQRDLRICVSVCCKNVSCFSSTVDGNYSLFMRRYSCSATDIILSKNNESLLSLIITFILHNQEEKSMPNCEVSFANGELHHTATLTTEMGKPTAYI